MDILIALICKNSLSAGLSGEVHTLPLPRTSLGLDTCTYCVGDVLVVYSDNSVAAYIGI